MKQATAFQYIATTGAGVAIGGTGRVDLAGVYRASEAQATTITVKDSATTLLVITASAHVMFSVPVACNGPLTATSSGGNMVLIFRQKPA